MVSLRPFQKDALSALKAPQHIICVAPTGSGKSLIFQEWIRKYRRRTLLITPLVALARQQYSAESNSTGRLESLASRTDGCG